MGGKLYLESILVPNKCGTRFFNEITDIIGKPINVGIFDRSIDWCKIKYVVIRDPLEIFHSALHTEYFNFIRHTDEIIERMLDLKNGDDHFYSKLYFHLNKKWEQYGFQIINISNLTNFVTILSGQIIDLQDNKHTSKQFHKNITKNDIYNFFLINYPEEIKKIEEFIEEDTVWYELLKSKEVI